MPESVKDLTIRLAFEHGDTKSQVAAIRNEIKALETDFAASAAAAGGFSAGLTESAARSKMLEQQIELQRMAVEKYGKAIDAEKNKIKSAQDRQQEYNQKLKDAKARQEELKASKETLTDAMKAEAKQNGESSEAYKALEASMAELEQQISDNEKAINGWKTGISRADRQMVTADKNIQKYTIAQNEAKAAIGTMEKALTEQQRRVKAHADQLEAAEKKLRAYSDRATKAGEAQIKIGRTLSAASAGIAFAATTAAQAAIEWEDSFAGVRKTVSGTEEQLRSIEQALLDMQVPTDYTVLADIAANAGQLGIATDNVASFTRTMADLAETTNLTAEEGASEFAKFANVVGMSQDNFDRLGSTVVQLGNNMATTEADIMSMASRLASAGTQAGMSEADIMGISAGLSSLGLEAQAGGTAFSKLLIDMKVAAETGSERLDELARVAGMTGAQFKAAFEADAAQAVTQFIQGLSTGSESAIVMLDELGIKETRFRDTLLRTSNASGLFADAIQMANSAWEENTALAREADVRYKTTASRMKMLGKEVQRTAMAFGESVLPYLETGMEKLGELIDKFNALDKPTRDAIVRAGLIAAAIGPGVSLLGTANKALGGAAGALANFAKTLAQGAGGVSGLMSALGGLLGPAGVLAVAAALVYGVYKLYDWASGAKAAREATEALNAAAKDWINTQAKTIYDTGNSDPLGLFGLSRDDFAGASKEARDWFDELVTVWTDGEKETGEIVKRFSDAFAENSDGVREAIETQKGTLDEYDALTPEAKAQMDADLKQLDDWDKEVAALLKKRQNGYLTDDETARLNEIINARGQLAIQYSVEEGDGYQQIITQMQADVERAAHGGRLDSDYFGNVLNALAEGRAAYNDALDETYRAEYANIQAIKDEEARTKALDELNARYQARRQEGEDAYNQSVLEAGKTTWENGGFAGQLDIIDQLLAKLGDLEGADIPAIEAFASENLDEGSLASMIALVEQLKAAGATDDDLKALGVDYQALLEKINAIRDISKDTKGLEGLADMFGAALPEEIQRVMVGLDMTQAAADWEAFANGENLPAIKARVDESSLDLSALEDLTGTVTGIYEGKKVTLDLSTLDALTGTVTVYDEDGNATVTNLEKLHHLTGEVTAYREGKKVTFDAARLKGLQATASVKLNPLDAATIRAWNAANKDKNLTAPPAKVNVTLGTDWESELQQAFEAGKLQVYGADGLPLEVTPDLVKQITASDVAVYDEDGTLHVIVTPELGTTEAVDVANQVADTTPVSGTIFEQMGSSAAEEVAGISAFTDAVRRANEQIDALNAAGKTVDAEGRTLQDLERFRDISLTEAIDSLAALDDADLSKVGGQVATIMAALNSGNLDPKTAAEYTEQLHAILDVVSTADEYLGAGNNISEGIAKGMNTYSFDTDARSVAAAITGAVKDELDESPVEVPVIAEPEAPAEETFERVGRSATKEVEGISAFTDAVRRANEQIDALNASGRTVDAEGRTLQDLERFRDISLTEAIDSLAALDDADLGEIGGQVAAIMAALNSGDLDPEAAAEYAGQLQAILDVVSTADEYLGAGNDISEGIARGMNEYNFSADAQSLATALTGAIDNALGAHSPATALIPTGNDVSEGIAKGMAGFQFAAACAAVSASIRAGFGSIGAQGQSAGEQFTAGLRRGLTGQLGGVVAEAKAAADQIAAAFRDAWQIHSPSRVAENLTRMFGAGLEKGMDKWPTVSQRMLENDLAMAYGTSSRAADAIRQTTNNNNDSVNLNIAELRVNDRQDVEALAYEIASLKRRTDRGRGLR